MTNTERKGFLSNRIFQIVLLAADVVLFVVIIIGAAGAKSTQSRPDMQINISVTTQPRPEDAVVTAAPENETVLPSAEPAPDPSETGEDSDNGWNEDWLKGGM